MAVAGLVMILIGAPLGIWVSAQSADPDPTPTMAAVGGGSTDVAADDLEPERDPLVAQTGAATPTPTRSPTDESALQLDDSTAVASPDGGDATSPPATSTATIERASPTAEPTSTPTPAPTPTPEPTFTASSEPECAVSDESVVVGQPLTVACSGFIPGSTVRLYWEGIGNSQTSFEASQSGTGEASFAVPEVRVGNWHARASDGEGRSAIAPLRLTNTRMSIGSVVGERGATLAVDVSGYRSGEQVALRWYGVEGEDYNTLRTVTVAEDGSASIEVEVPGRSEFGRHRVAAVGLTSGVLIERIYRVVSPSEPVNFFQGTTGCNRIAFIFNVGMGNEADPGVLNTLRQEDVPATMFVMGWYPQQFPESFQAIVDSGLPIASHGYDAINMTGADDATVRNDIRAADDALTAALGRPPDPWFTPYAGAIDDRVRGIVVSEGLVPVGWRITTNDWSPDVSADRIYQQVVDSAYDGAIVEFHLDAPTTEITTAEAFPRIIATLRERGYTFVTIPQLEAPCGTPAANGPVPTTIEIDTPSPEAESPPASPVAVLEQPARLVRVRGGRSTARGVRSVNNVRRPGASMRTPLLRSS